MQGLAFLLAANETEAGYGTVGTVHARGHPVADRLARQATSKGIGDWRDGMKREISNFLVMDAMAEANKDIRLAPLSNITNLQKTKHGTLITIGAEGDLVAAIGVHNRFLGGLLLADREQFKEMKAHLTAARAPAMEELLEELSDFLDGQVDSVDGDMGQPAPNAAAVLKQRIDDLLGKSEW
jgi:hypothetical protein